MAISTFPGYAAEIAAKADKTDLAGIIITGSINNTGSTIAAGTYFYKDGALVRAKTAIASGATLTLNTNYETVTAGGLNELKSAFVFIAINADTSASFGFVDTGLSIDTYYVVGAVLPFESNYSVRVSNLASPGNYRFQIINDLDGSVVDNGATYFVHIVAIKRSLFTEIT